MTPHRRSVAWAAIFGVLFAAVELLGLLLLAEYSVYQIVWMRYAVHLVIILFAFGGRELLLPFRAENRFRQMLRSLLMLVMPVSWGVALSLGIDQMALAAGLAMTPALLVMIVFLRTGKPISLTAWGCAALSLMGGLLIDWHHLHRGAEVVLPIATALCLALYIAETEQLRREPSRINLFLTAFWVFLVLTPIQGWHWVTPPFHDLPVIFAIGAVGLVALLAIDHMTRGPGVIAGTVFVNVQVLVPVGFTVWRDQGLPSRSVLAALAVMAVAAALAWQGESLPFSAEFES